MVQVGILLAFPTISPLLLVLTPNISSGDPNAVQDFSLLWISEFKKTNAYEVWERVTDPMLFDIVEPRYVHLWQKLHFSCHIHISGGLDIHAVNALR